MDAEGRWRVLWRAIAGDDYTPIPARGSFVRYNPQLHADQSKPPPQSTKYPVMINLPLLCKVVHVELLTTDPPECEVYAHFRLRPALPSELPTDGTAAGHYIDIGEPDGLYTKVLSAVDQQVGAALHVSADLRNGLNQPPQPGVVCWFKYMQEGAPTALTYDVRDGDMHFTSAAWSQFRSGKNFSQGDALLFAVIKGGQLIGLRRGVYKLAAACTQIATAYESCHVGVGTEFVLEYYPRARSPFLTLVGN